MCENALNEKTDMIKGETKAKALRGNSSLQALLLKRANLVEQPAPRRHCTRRPMAITNHWDLWGRLPTPAKRPSTQSPIGLFCSARDHILLLIQHDTVEWDGEVVLRPRRPSLPLGYREPLKVLQEVLSKPPFNQRRSFSA
jgi:hypothetical protein